MDNSNSVSDPTDWLQSSLPVFSPLETALRCQVCKDFYNNPVITSCSHTFCSLCIRRCLSNDGKCPACRAGEQASKLRRNWALEETVAAFQTARPAALDIATAAKRLAHGQGSAGRSSKRRRVDDKASDQDVTESQRQTRSRSKKMQEPQSSQDEPIEIEETDGEEETHADPEDGLVSCPMCGKRMKEEAVFTHLDRCDTEQKEGSRPERYSFVRFAQ